MKTKWIRFFVPVMALALSPMLAQTTYDAVVDARANIYGSGLATLPASGGGAGVAPALIDLGFAGRSRTLQVVNATGIVDCCNGAEPNGADGNTTHGGSKIMALDPFSGIEHANRRMFLVGVFLDSNTPSGTAPTTLDFTNDFKSLSPALRQVFFIGDGRNAAGQAQNFEVPGRATRLYLGFADAFNFQGKPGWYDDNRGSLTVRLSVTIKGLFDVFQEIPVDPTLYPNPTRVAVGPDRVYVLANDEVHMLDRTTLQSTFGLPIRGTLEPVSLVNIKAIALYRDRFLLITGGLRPLSSGVRRRYLQAFLPSQSGNTPVWSWVGLPGEIPVLPEAEDFITASTSDDCVFLGGTDAGGQGYLAKFRWGINPMQWSRYLDGRVTGISTHPAFSNVQVSGVVGGEPNQRGFFQVFAQSGGGTPGPRHTWPEANSYTTGVSPAGPGKGVYVFGAAGNGPNLLRRYSFDGTLLWTNPMADPGLPINPAADAGGVWAASQGSFSYIEIFFNLVGFNKEPVYSRYEETRWVVVRYVEARDGSVYGVATARGIGYAFKIIGPSVGPTLLSKMDMLSPGARSHLQRLMSEGDWAGGIEALLAMKRTGELTAEQGDHLISLVRDRAHQ